MVCCNQTYYDMIWHKIMYIRGRPVELEPPALRARARGTRGAGHLRVQRGTYIYIYIYVYIYIYIRMIIIIIITTTTIISFSNNIIIIIIIIIHKAHYYFTESN